MTIQTTIDRSSARAIGPLPKDHPPVKPRKTGVMLVNLGTPDATDYWSMRRYLSEFLSDKRVIEWPSVLWQPILQGIVLSRRPKKSGAAYDEIWNQEKNESPLRTFTRSQSDKLAAALSEHDHIHVDWAMRYGNPSMESVVTKMMDAGCDRIVMFPLYPQYSATTTATVNDKFFDALKKLRFQPAARTVPSYYDEPIYIEALARSIENHMATLEFDPEVEIGRAHV